MNRKCHQWTQSTIRRNHVLPEKWNVHVWFTSRERLIRSNQKYVSKILKHYSTLNKLSPRKTIPLNKHRPRRVPLPYTLAMKKQLATRFYPNIALENPFMLAIIMNNISILANCIMLDDRFQTNPYPGIMPEFVERHDLSNEMIEPENCLHCGGRKNNARKRANKNKKLHRHKPQIEKVGTDGSQRGNQRLPWQGTAGSQTLKLTVPNLGTRGYHCKELPVPRS